MLKSCRILVAAIVTCTIPHYTSYNDIVGHINRHSMLVLLPLLSTLTLALYVVYKFTSSSTTTLCY
jgi:hypothetical protein